MAANNSEAATAASYQSMPRMNYQNSSTRAALGFGGVVSDAGSTKNDACQKFALASEIFVALLYLRVAGILGSWDLLATKSPRLLCFPGGLKVA